MRPDCIMLDESTAMLDPKGRKEVMDTVLKLNREKGITVLHITHNMDEAALADRVVVMDEGKVVLDGTPREVFAQGERLTALGLDVPQPTALCTALRQRGVAIADGLLTPEECAEAILTLLKS